MSFCVQYTICTEGGAKLSVKLFGIKALLVYYFKIKACVYKIDLNIVISYYKTLYELTVFKIE